MRRLRACRTTTSSAGDTPSRFRRLGGNRYPRRVADAYDGDLERAAVDSDEQIAATVASWEREQGLEPIDWPALAGSETRTST